MLEVQGNAEVNDFFRVRPTQKVTRQPARKGILIDTGVGDIRYIPLSLIIGIIYIKVKIRSFFESHEKEKKSIISPTLLRWSHSFSSVLFVKN